MPCTVTAFSVKIAFPGNAAMELIIAREVMARWNSHHALAQKRILLPFDEENEGSECGNDLLVSFFCNSSAGMDTVSGETEAEIDRQLKGGKPALIFFSEAREDLTGHPKPESRPFELFKKRYASATIDSYADEKEFAAKFAQQLEATIENHPLFKVATASDAKQGLAPDPEEKPEAPLSECAQVILFEACDDFEGYIGRIKAGTMLRIQANGRQLVEPQDAETIAKWNSAFNELLNGEYIRNAGMNGQLFQISPKGFAFLKTIGRSPVGYIAELGGM